MTSPSVLVRRPARVASADPGNPVAVHLAGQDNLLGGQAQVGIDARPVLGNGCRVVAHVLADVERGERPLADATQPGEHGVDQAVDGQAFKVIGYELVMVLAFHNCPTVRRGIGHPALEWHDNAWY